uniref:Transposase n=2 Tax=unclassified bacterial viruses TaxID=12333 RepID=A0AAU6W1F6_9VIRU
MQLHEDCLSREYRLEREAHEAYKNSLKETEGQRLVKLCIAYGATPGGIHKWLKKRLEATQKLEAELSKAHSDAAWQAEYQREQDAARDHAEWK